MQARQKFLWVEGKLENGNEGCMLQLTPFHKVLVCTAVWALSRRAVGVSEDADCATHSDGQTVPGAKAEYCGKKPEVEDFQ